MRTAEKQRVEKLLDSALIKLSVAASDIFGVSGPAMTAALTAGQRNPRVPAQPTHGPTRAKDKLRRLEEAFSGRFTQHHAFLRQTMLDRIGAIDAIDADLTHVQTRIEEHLTPFGPGAGTGPA